MQIGVISDTHGVLHPRALELLAGVAHIIHAGDIGKQEIITALETIAPVSAVTGNVDWGGPLDQRYPRTLMLMFEGYRLYVTHIGGKPKGWSRRLPHPLPDIAICGHSHIPLVETYKGVLYLNPGAAGRSRLGRGLSVAILTLTGGLPGVELLSIK